MKPRVLRVLAAAIAAAALLSAAPAAAAAPLVAVPYNRGQIVPGGEFQFTFFSSGWCMQSLAAAASTIVMTWPDGQQQDSSGCLGQFTVPWTAKPSTYTVRIQVLERPDVAWTGTVTVAERPVVLHTDSTDVEPGGTWTFNANWLSPAGQVTLDGEPVGDAVWGSPSPDGGQVAVAMPDSLGPGTHTLTVRMANGQAGSITLRAVRPAIESVSPGQVAAGASPSQVATTGQPIEIRCTGCGVHQGPSRVYVGRQEAQILDWQPVANMRQAVTALVPPGLPTGRYPVTVVASTGKSNPVLIDVRSASSPVPVQAEPVAPSRAAAARSGGPGGGADPVLWALPLAALVALALLVARRRRRKAEAEGAGEA